MGVDLVELALLAALALCFVGLAAAVFWPTDRADVMQDAHGDQPSLPR